MCTCILEKTSGLSLTNLQKATFLIIYRYKLKITYWLLAYFSFKFGLLLNSVNVKTNFNWSLKVSFSRIITYIWIFQSSICHTILLHFFKKKNLGIEGMCSNFFTRTTTLNARYWGGRLVGIRCIYLDSIRTFELFRTFKSPIKYC